jgi:hypothetical protein
MGFESVLSKALDYVEVFLLSNAKPAKNDSQEVVRREFTGDFAERLLS